MIGDETMNQIKGIIKGSDVFQNPQSYKHNIDNFLHIRKGISTILTEWEKIKEDSSVIKEFSIAQEEIKRQWYASEIKWKDVPASLLGLLQDPSIKIIFESLEKDIFLHLNSATSMGLTRSRICQGYFTNPLENYINLLETIQAGRKIESSDYDKIMYVGGAIVFELEGIYNLTNDTNFISNGIAYDFLRYLRNNSIDYRKMGDASADYQVFKNTFKNEIDSFKPYIQIESSEFDFLTPVEKVTLKENLIADRIAFVVIHSLGKTKETKKPKDIIPEIVPEISLSSSSMTPHPLNQILYGPPGTGKTYHSVNYALSIIEEKSIEELANEERSELLKRFNEYKQNGQIVFTTFHQSFSYEDFIEGLKAKTDETGNIRYEIEDGLFKKISQSAMSESIESNTESQINLDATNIFKLSLGVADEENDIYDYCIENNVVAIGYSNLDFSILEDTPDYLKAKKEITGIIGENNSEKFTADAIYRFKNWLQVGDLVFISKGNSFLRAIGVIEGKYEYRANTAISYNHFRKVKWLIKDVSIPVEKLQDRKFSQQGIYNLKDSLFKDTNLNLIYISSLLGKKKEKKENYVLIIDEINRGNISKIFGELITLLETSKRHGNNEALSTKLPYSGDNFSVPNNLYILGTMNTSDRSIALMDIALRRRFSFTEMTPDDCVLDNIFVDDIDIKKLFITLNARIEFLYDSDHLLGQAFFIPLKESATLEMLNEIFIRIIIPLLQEYFYEDGEKIQLILGDHEEQGWKDWSEKILQESTTKKENILGIRNEEYEDKKVYTVNSDPTLNSYRKIYEH